MKKICKKTISFVNFRSFFGICVLGLLTFYFTSCTTLQFQSGWRDREITVDGRSDDWIGSLTYMDKQNISLGLDFPFAIGAEEGSEIGIGIEIPKMTMTLNRAPGGMSGRGGSMGGRGGSMGVSMGGRSGGMTGQRANMQKGIKIWATVLLASAK